MKCLPPVRNQQDVNLSCGYLQMADGKFLDLCLLEPHPTVLTMGSHCHGSSTQGNKARRKTITSILQNSPKGEWGPMLPASSDPCHGSEGTGSAGESRPPLPPKIQPRGLCPLCFVLQPYPVVLGEIPGSALRDHFWQCVGNHMGCWGSNLGQPYARQSSSLLYYYVHSGCGRAGLFPRSIMRLEEPLISAKLTY